MKPSEHNWNEQLWKRTQQRIKNAVQLGIDAFLAVCGSLIIEWCCDRQQVTEFLKWAVSRNKLDTSMLDAWLYHQEDSESRAPSQRDGTCDEQPRPRDQESADPDQSEPRRDLARSADSAVVLALCPLPIPLHRYVVAIERFGRKQGGAAIEVGKQLCDAQRVCSQAAYRFADFLDYVKQNYGLSRSTCYLYMKYHQWELPNVLGSAVMKWIVQGFQPGSPDAQTVIEAAVSEGLTLAALSTRFGHLRDQVQIGTSKSADGTNQKIIQRLTKQEQRLRAKQREIERRLEGVTRRLRQLQLGLPDGQDSSALTHHIDIN